MHSLIKNRSCNIVPNLHAYNFPSNFFLFLNCFMFLFFTIVSNSCTVWKTFFCEYVHFPFLFLTGNLLNVPILITFPNNVSLNPNSLHLSELFLPIFKISNFKIFAPPPGWKPVSAPVKNSSKSDTMHDLDIYSLVLNDSIFLIEYCMDQRSLQCIQEVVWIPYQRLGNPSRLEVEPWWSRWEN